MTELELLQQISDVLNVIVAIQLVRLILWVVSSTYNFFKKFF